MVVLEVAQTCNRGSSCINGAAPLLSVSVAPHRACLLTQLRAERGHGLQIRAQQAAQTMSGHPDAVRRAEERRLRRETLAIELMRPDTSGPWYKGEHPSNMVEVYTVDDLEKQVQRTDCLVVVEVFVPACPGCRKLFPKIKQIASNNPDVRFVQVNADPANEELHSYVLKELKIQVLPYFVLYKRGHRVSTFGASLRRVDMIRAEIAANKDEILCKH